PLTQKSGFQTASRRSCYPHRPGPDPGTAWSICRRSFCGGGVMTRTLVLAGVLSVFTSATETRASTLPANFQEPTVSAGLTEPTAVRFAADGRVFVAEKRGIIKVFSSLSATTPTIFADLRVNVFNYWDRGLLGLELDPRFPATPYVYVLYTLDRAPGGTIPTWGGSPGSTTDPCPTPPGGTTSGCAATARPSRLE